MSRLNRVLIFYSLLLLNHFFHIYEIQTRGFKQDFSTNGNSFSAGLIFRLFLLSVIILVGWQLFRRQEAAYRLVKWVSILFLAYGLFSTIAIVYSEAKIIGSFSGFIFVMICLPMLLNVTDHLKIESEDAAVEDESDDF